MKAKRLAIILVAMFVFTPLVAFGSYIDFVGNGGDYTATLYSDGTFAGSGAITRVYGGQTDLNAGQYFNVTNGYYTFQTGVLSGGGVGGSFDLYGGIPDAQIADGTKLATGYFTVANLTVFNGLFSFTGFVTDTKADALVDFFYANRPLGWTGNVVANGMENLRIEGFVESVATIDSRVPTQTFDVASSDFVNQPVPEPGTLLLLGSGLVGLAGLGRKKFKK